MHRNSPVSNSRHNLCVLYERTQQGDARALPVLLNRATRELERYLRRRVSSRVAAGLREIAAQAIEDALLRIVRISSWERAWAYARKVAERAIRRELKRRRKERSLPHLLEVPDPRSGAAARWIDLEDAVSVHAPRMSMDDSRIFTSMVLGHPHLHVLSRELGIPGRTLKRRRRELRQRVLGDF